MDHGRGREEVAGEAGQRFAQSVKGERGREEVRREDVRGGNKGTERAWPSSALEGGREGGERRKQSARGKAIVGLLEDHESNKKSQYDDFSRKVQFREINLKQLLVIKTRKCQISVLYFALLHCGKGVQTWRWTGALCRH